MLNSYPSPTYAGNLECHETKSKRQMMQLVDVKFHLARRHPLQGHGYYHRPSHYRNDFLGQSSRDNSPVLQARCRRVPRAVRGVDDRNVGDGTETAVGKSGGALEGRGEPFISRV